ncbi:hypothetical protein [Leptospira sp. GIMC2001]|uniref:hypothetical protein n=1 Tax=Leptospira sp. GIMC2001 TaxID=1513297 RepID=UPI00234AAFEA|nr:hypothetical protein [Leptospira sp. GIMC2001]WCL48258.1 hypothetical protein O4O04_13190 [Leptospira sp. GIMC2001]
MKFWKIIVMSCFMFFSCSSFFWRDAELPKEEINYNGSILEYQVVYKEKDSLNPLMGTTEKKNYETKIAIYPQGKNKQSIKIENIGSWILPGMIHYNPTNDRLFWVQGINDEYGTNLRKAGVATDVRVNGLKNAKFWTDCSNITTILPSPTGDAIAMICSENQLESDNASINLETAWKIAIWNIADSSPTVHSLNMEWVPESNDHTVRWIGTNSVEVRSGSKKSQWKSK